MPFRTANDRASDSASLPFKVLFRSETIAEFADRRDAYEKAMELSRATGELVVVKRNWFWIAAFRGGFLMP
jgi:hypothetical protein